VGLLTTLFDELPEYLKVDASEAGLWHLFVITHIGHVSIIIFSLLFISSGKPERITPLILIMR
jgi:hypothetical protein